MLDVSARHEGAGSLELIERRVRNRCDLTENLELALTRAPRIPVDLIDARLRPAPTGD